MHSFWLYSFITFAGAMQALGNSMNAQLRNSLQNPCSLQNPWLASLISFLLILAFFVCAFAAMPLPTVESVATMPWWAPFGGLAGALAVFAGLTMVDKIGAWDS